MANDMGDWTVDIDPEVPDHVRLQMTEMDENGGEQKNYYFPPATAWTIGTALRNFGLDLQG